MSNALSVDLRDRVVAAIVGGMSCRQAALRRQAADGRATSEVSAFGVKFVVDGPLLVEGGRLRPILSVWIIEGGEGMFRFVTAYPLESRRAAR